MMTPEMIVDEAQSRANAEYGRIRRETVAYARNMLGPTAEHVFDAALPKVFVIPKLDRAATPAPEPRPVGVIPGEALLGKAVQHRGLRYTWGGDGVSTFDCSALTQRAAKDIGVTIGRTTYDQIRSGQEIAWGQQQIGDLVFSRFSDTDGVWETPEHVSIWAGNGKVFEAGDPIDFYAWGDRGTVRVRRIA
ncbi:NlpC-P60 family cell wall hydrolase [Rhodococcus phage Mbo2]|uniref:NlpC-P60 family cell wall hydrolase n=1 Tax=Rhodococcus phage Mbo2 TaxID=2936911 RepID=A0A9E7IGL3_9CAUD|nr:NlpC-P60 family cell wall hydrolase [Rhodococcus phage Mbo2]